jgi:hypothetical protein
MSGRGNVKNEKSSGLLDSFSARAYARRFGNYVAAHAKFKDVGPSTQGRGSTISDEFAELLHVYRGTDKEIYMSLLEDFEKRGKRLRGEVRTHKIVIYCAGAVGPEEDMGSCGIEPHGAATSGDQGVFFGDILVVVPG